MCFIRTKRLPDESKKGSVSILDHLIFYLGEVNCQTTPHYKPRQVEAAYIECGNSAAAMQVSQVNLFEQGPTWATLNVGMVLWQCK